MKGYEAVERIKQAAGSEHVFEIYTMVGTPGLPLEDLTPFAGRDTIVEVFLREPGRVIRREIRLAEMRTTPPSNIKDREEIRHVGVADDELFALVGVPCSVHYRVIRQPEEELSLNHQRMVEFHAENFQQQRARESLQKLFDGIGIE